MNRPCHYLFVRTSTWVLVIISVPPKPPPLLPTPCLAHKIPFYFGSMYWIADSSWLSVFVNVDINWNSFLYVIVSLLNDNNRSSSNNNNNNYNNSNYASMEKELITGWNFFYTYRKIVSMKKESAVGRIRD
jgi:hypothetical protein